MKRWIVLAILLFSVGGVTQAQDAQPLPVIVDFSIDVESLTLAEVEAGETDATLSWTIANFEEGYEIVPYAYEIGTWVALITDEDDALEPVAEFELTVRHPLNFNAPTYRLVILDENFQVYSEAVVMIPYNTEDVVFEPAIASFTVQETSIEANAVAYNGAQLNVSWEVTDRTPQSNLVFEQIQSDGSIVSVELPRRNAWVASTGSGSIAPVLPDQGTNIVLRLKLVDLVTGDILDEAGQQVSVSGSVASPTPRPTDPPAPTAEPNQPEPEPEQPEQPAEEVASNDPPPASGPVAQAGTSGGFELGGHVATFARLDIAQAAGMTWVKKQVRWQRSEGTGNAAAIINDAKANGFKVMLGIVGFRDQMGDFDAYTNEFAAYLGQVAALGPDAIEVWNEPNIDREWPAGTINGTNYTTMLAKAFNAIKAANPSVMVISGAPAPTGFFGGCANSGCDDNVFLRQMANAGAAQYMDCIGAHYNEGIISPDQNSGDPRGGHYSRYFNAMLNLYYNTFGGSRQVCWTELGFLSGEGYSPLPGGFAWAQNTSLAQHAEWLGLAAQRSRESGRVRLMIVWNVDFQVYDSDPQAGYAILRPDGSCPACAILAASR